MITRRTQWLWLLALVGAVGCSSPEPIQDLGPEPSGPSGSQETQDEVDPIDDGVVVPDAGDASAPVHAPVDAGDAGPASGADCEGYTEILGPATNTVRRAYSAKVKATCLTVKAMCATNVPDSRKILCAALDLDGVYYGNGYSTTYGGSKAVPFYGFSAPSGANYGLQPAAWLAARTPGLSPRNLLECSGLTAVALLKAYNFSSTNLYCSGQFTEQRNPALFQQMTAATIRPGDFLTKTFGCNSSTSGHVAIAASAVDAGSVIVYETNSWKKPARFTERELAYFAGGWSRFKR